ncbi:MAG: glycosyl hydrolase family 17 protein [Rubrivivax sp.]
MQLVSNPFTGGLGRRLRSAHRWLRTALLGATVAGLLTACDGGGTVPDTGVQRRALSPELAQREAVNYSPFRSANRDTETVTRAMIQQDLELLVQANLRLIRLFDTSDMVARQTLEVIRDRKLDIKVQLGFYLNRGQEAGNQQEIARGVALAREFKDQVLALSVGNETMVSWSFNPIAPAEMARYIKQVRDLTTQPVTTDDNWAFFANADGTVLDQIDFVAMHTYPLLDTVFNPGLWDWQQEAVPAERRAVAMMDAAIARAKFEYRAVRQALDSQGRRDLPIVVGETGWKATPAGGELNRAHPVNQKMFYDRLREWQREARTTGEGPKTIYVFQAFDEPWKQGDDRWGLFNVARQARWVIQGQVPQALWEPGEYTLSQALYFAPTASNPPVTANRYTVYADATTPGEVRPAEAPVFNAWDSGATAAYPQLASAAAPGDAPNGIQITPQPKVWGWGLALGLPTTADDLSAFRASGTLNFSIRTTYPGTLEVGFLTGTAGSASLFDVYLPLSPGQYGYRNDGQWHQVSIPISAIIPFGAKAFDNSGSPTAVLDLTKVTNPFVIADRYGTTGKAQGSNITTVIEIDGVYWAK